LVYKAVRLRQKRKEYLCIELEIQWRAPDIYFIILEDMTSGCLEDEYAYDNSEFLNTLRAELLHCRLFPEQLCPDADVNGIRLNFNASLHSAIEHRRFR
jgi:hypothetical protein